MEVKAEGISAGGEGRGEMRERPLRWCREESGHSEWPAALWRARVSTSAPICLRFGRDPAIAFSPHYQAGTVTIARSDGTRLAHSFVRVPFLTGRFSPSLSIFLLSQSSPLSPFCPLFIFCSFPPSIFLISLSLSFSRVFFPISK